MKATPDDSTMAPWRGTEPGAVVLGELEIRSALPDEMQRITTLLNDEHHLDAGRQVGRTLVQIVHHRERWVAILVWGPAAMKLIDRDEWTLLDPAPACRTPRSHRPKPPFPRARRDPHAQPRLSRNNLASIHRYSQFLTQQQRVWLEWLCLKAVFTKSDFVSL